MNRRTKLIEELNVQLPTPPDSETANAADPIEIILPEDAATECAKEQKLPPDVIKGVLPQGGKAAVGGASKGRKTWMFIDMAISVASGNVCLNSYPTQKGKVLYFNFELPKPFFWKRVQAVCNERQITLERGMLDVHHLRGRVGDWLRIEPQIPAGKYSLIVLDPSYKLLLIQTERLREENNAGTIATLLDRFEQLAVRTGAAVIFGAHFSKGGQAGKDSIDRISGSGVFARDPDSIITLTELSTPDCYAVELTLRLHPPMERFAMRWEYPLFTPDVSLDPGDLKQRNKGAAEKQHTLAELVELFERPMLVREICEVAQEKMSRRTFFRLWDEGKADRAFLKCKDGKWKVNLKWITKQN